MSSANSTILEDVPFCIGALNQPENPSPIPSVFPLELKVDEGLGAIVQVPNPTLMGYLDAAYTLGIELGTPSDDTELGRPYVEDFLSFLRPLIPKYGTVLEIGAGTGYLSRRMLDEGWRVDSMEPGEGFAEHWQRYDVKVINEFFPSSAISGEYDAIVCYTVLEHIGELGEFLAAVRAHLKPRGRFIASVPDCTLEIQAADPAMLVHEHFHYFSAGSLRRTLQSSGFSQTTVQSSKFGRSLYAAATASDGGSDEVSGDDLALVRNYLTRVVETRQEIETRVLRALQEGQVGVFCPLRAISSLPRDPRLRFFDDSPILLGRYFPPFDAPIEGRPTLFESPPKTLFIASRTFGPRLKLEIEAELSGTRVEVL
jgi:SAM-dependent methyltransferase